MGSDQRFVRLDIREIKNLLFRNIGHQRAEKYFDQLGRFLTSRVTKSEFDKFCIKTIGRENIPLHNRLIRSIIKNASVAKSPPLRNPKKFEKTVKSIRSSSPWKCRSGGNFIDRPSPLGPLGKSRSITTTSTNDESPSKTQSPMELLSLGSRPPMEVASVEEGEEVEQISGSPGIQSKTPLTAPFGISIRNRRRKTISNSGNLELCQIIGELPDIRTLRNRLEKKLELEGMRISEDSVNLLNNGLDAFLRRLIEPSLNLAQSRRGNEPRRSPRVSMWDLRAAMEMNPSVLGEEWPLYLERISSQASEE